MRIVIAPDSFKGSLRSPAVAAAMADGARRVFPEGTIDQCPVGDGGEGTLAALLAAEGGETREVAVQGPLGEPLTASLGLLGDGATVFVEMAAASGLSCLPPERRDPFRATSGGTGELLAAAYATGRRRIAVGLGGSATNDGGAGLLAALGARLLDRDGQPVPAGGAALSQLVSIDLSELRRPPPGTELLVVSDVTNPLCGPEGASAIYGPQKGAGPEDVAALDAALGNFAAVAGRALGRDWQNEPGAGAAGGVGFALMAFLGARVVSGVEWVLAAVRLAGRLRGANLALTGEGRIDGQTFAYGKTLAGVGRCCREAGVPCLAFAGGLADDLGDHQAAGIGAVLDVTPRPMPLAEAMTDAAALVARGVERGLRLFVMGRESARQPASAAADRGRVG